MNRFPRLELRTLSPFALHAIRQTLGFREQRQLIARFRDNPDQLEAFTVLLVQRASEDIPPDPEEGEGRFSKFFFKLLNWFAEHKDFIEWLSKLFGGALTPAEVNTMLAEALKPAA